MRYPNDGLREVEINVQPKSAPPSTPIVFDNFAQSVNKNIRFDKSDLIERTTQAVKKAVTTAELSGEEMTITIHCKPAAEATNE